MEFQSEEELKPTFKSKRLRLQKLIEFIKNKQRANFAEIYQFMMGRYWLTTRTIDNYIKDLEASGIIQVVSNDPYIDDPWFCEPKKRYAVYKGEG
ncbi:MAG: hypothetical protein QW175_07090 [Candidatus Bathyarchaeia archaeon]